MCVEKDNETTELGHADQSGVATTDLALVVQSWQRRLYVCVQDVWSKLDQTTKVESNEKHLRHCAKIENNFGKCPCNLDVSSELFA